MAWVRQESRCIAEKQFCKASLDSRFRLSHLCQPGQRQPLSGWPPACQQVMGKTQAPLAGADLLQEVVVFWSPAEIFL